MGRQTSLLTESQREYLQEGKEGATGRMARKRIRERVHAGLFDFPLLVSGLDEKDRKWIFEDHDLENKDHTLNILSSAFAFLYLGITDTVEPTDLAKDAFEDMVATGVRQAYNQQGVSLQNVDVDIDVTVGESVDDLKNREELGLPELLQLTESDEMSDEELVQSLVAMLRSDNPEAGIEAFPELVSINRPEGEEKPEGLDDIDEIEFVIAEEGDEEESDESDVYDPTKEFEDG